MGKIYYDMGLLSTAEVVDCSATDLIGQYVGQTGPKTQRLLEKALGKVLFIDEAYRLAEGHFAKEAMDEIVDCITKPKFAQKLVIILAGYDEDMNRLMAINPGLTSRFPESIQFRGLAPDDCIMLLTQLLQADKKKFQRKQAQFDMTVLEAPDADFFRQLRQRFRTLSQSPNWANARDVQTLAKTIFGKEVRRVVRGKLTVDKGTILAKIDRMINDRMHRDAFSQMGHIAGNNNPQVAVDGDTQTATITSTKTSTSTNNATQGHPSSDKDTQCPAEQDTRDPGVADDIWRQLQQDKQAADAREKAYKQLGDQERAILEAIDKAKQAEQDAATAAAEAEKQRSDNEAKKHHEEERIRRELERRAREEELEKLRKKREEEEERRRKEHAAKKKLRHMGVCPVGYRWIKQANGYRCAGGSHFVSNAQLGM